MINKDNKTTIVGFKKLAEFGKILEKFPMIISSVDNTSSPNICVVSDYCILDNKKILISNNEMVNTPDNILKNENVCLICLSSNYSGIRLRGTAKYYDSGEMFDLVKKKFENENTTPKGAIVVEVLSVETFD